MKQRTLIIVLITSIVFLAANAEQSSKLNHLQTIATEYYQLAQIFEQENPDKAITFYKKATELDPESFDVLHQFANLLKKRDLLQEAAEAYRKTVALQPRNIHVMMELASTLHMLSQYEEALEIYQKIIEINPNIISALYNFGFTLKRMGKLKRAQEVYQQVLARKPDYPLAHFSLSGIYLALGNFRQGWQEYEWRWKAYNEEPKKYNCPRWNNEDLTNKTLLIYTEQGLGDTLQFIRYAQLIKERYEGVRIVLQAQTPLILLLRKQIYIDHVQSHNEPIEQAHYHIPLMSLPYVFQTELHSIPAKIPYIQADPALVESWSKQLDSSEQIVRVGICWQGNAQYSTQTLRRAVAEKSVTLKQLEPLFHIDGLRIYSLQRINGEDQISECTFAEKLVSFDATFDQKNGRFMDTAAVIQNLDLIITADTSIAHLAGAMGKQTWILLPQPTCWRWLLDRTDSPWYQTVTLFHQDKPGNWEPVIQKVTDRLNTMCSKKESLQQPKKSNFHNEPDIEQIRFFQQIINAIS